MTIKKLYAIRILIGLLIWTAVPILAVWAFGMMPYPRTPAGVAIQMIALFVVSVFLVPGVFWVGETRKTGVIKWSTVLAAGPIAWIYLFFKGVARTFSFIPRLMADGLAKLLDVLDYLFTSVGEEQIRAAEEKDKEKD